MSESDALDVLDLAARALLRDGAPARSNDATWSRIVTELRRGRRRRRWLTTAAVHLLALLAATGVWAAATGRLNVPRVEPSAAEAPDPSIGPGEEPPRTRHRPRPARTIPPLRTVEAASSESDAPPPVAPRRRLRPTLDAPAAPQPAAVDPLYVEAHRLHFGRRDFAAALPAWDRYLAGGTGTFVVEARYNRAIALIHLGRTAEAAAALRPFADGALDGYRQREARALLEKLGAGGRQ